MDKTVYVPGMDCCSSLYGRWIQLTCIWLGRPRQRWLAWRCCVLSDGSPTRMRLWTFTWGQFLYLVPLRDVPYRWDTTVFRIRNQAVVVYSLNHVWLCYPMACSTPGSSVLHCLLEFAQPCVLCTGDLGYPSHPLSPPFPSAPSLSQHQGLFQWAGSSHHVAKVLELQLQHQSFQWIFRADLFYDWLVWSPCSPKDSQESSLAP